MVCFKNFNGIKLGNLIITIVVLALLLWKFSFIVVDIVVAAVLSFIGMPIVDFFSKIKLSKTKHLPKIVAVLLTLLVLMICVSLMFFTFVPLIIQQIDVVSNINMDSMVEYTKVPIAAIESFIHRLHIVDADISLTQVIKDEIVKVFDPKTITNTFTNVIGSLGGFFISLFSILFIAFYFLKDEGLFTKLLMFFINNDRLEKVEVALEHIRKFLSRYFVGLVLEVGAMFVLESIGLAVIGVKGFLAIALMGSVFNIIPYVGPLIGTTLAVIVGTTSLISAGMYDRILIRSLLIIVVFVVSNWVDNFFLQPYIYSRSMQAHPLEIFLVILVFGSMGGAIGMILAIPGYTVLKVVSKEFFSKYEIISDWTKNMKL